jgi:hypothetical protein
MVLHVTVIKGAQPMRTRGNLSPTGISKPRTALLQKNHPLLEEPMENLGLVSWLWRRSLARRRTQRLEHTRQALNQQLAWRAQDIFAGCGLAQGDFSIAVGHVFHIPQVLSVVAGPPVGLKIRTLPGQMPDEFAAQAPAIAYNLGVSKVRVVPLGPSLIQLKLLPRVHAPHVGAS